jgi:hypothetical protein
MASAPLYLKNSTLPRGWFVSYDLELTVGLHGGALELNVGKIGIARDDLVELRYGFRLGSITVEGFVVPKLTY